jgi:hypothetical protein
MGLLMHSELSFVLEQANLEDPEKKLEFFRLYHDYNLIYKIQEKSINGLPINFDHKFKVFEVKKNIEGKIQTLKLDEEEFSRMR